MIELTQHGAISRSDPVLTRVEASCIRTGDGDLAVDFRATGTTSEVKIPSRCEPAFAGDLWTHTCFEVFIAREGFPGYHEYNLSPSGEWALFGFRAYRDGSPLADERFAPAIQFKKSPRTFRVKARLPIDGLSTELASSRLRVGLSAVIELRDGATEHWALRHPAEKPDFHHPDSFSLTVKALGDA